MRAPERLDEGFALVLVLWVIALLTVLSFSLAYGTRMQTKIYLNQYERARARASADTGVSLAILGILDRGPEARWRLDGSPRELTYGDAAISVRVQNEAGKIDLNRASTDVLANLFRTLGSDARAAQALATAVADWKSRRRSRWSQQSDQATSALTIGEIQPFLAVEEFRMVSGVTSELYDQISPFLTVFSGSDHVDPLSAAREVLLSLPGADARQVDAYVTARTEIGPDPAALPALDSIGPYLSSRTLAYASISSEGRIPPHARFIRNATVSLLVGSAERFRFVVWQQGRSSDE